MYIKNNKNYNDLSTELEAANPCYYVILQIYKG